MEFVQKFTLPDFQAKNFTLSISQNFNSFSGKKTQKISENGEIYTAGNKFYTPAGTDRMDKFHLWAPVLKAVRLFGHFLKLRPLIAFDPFPPP